MADLTPELHAHLDVCAECRDNPFDLCPIGAGLLSSAAVAVADAIAGARTSPAPSNGQDADDLLHAFQSACAAVVSEGDSNLSRTTKERAVLRNELRARLVASVERDAEIARLKRQLDEKQRVMMTYQSECARLRAEVERWQGDEFREACRAGGIACAGERDSARADGRFKDAHDWERFANVLHAHASATATPPAGDARGA